jgi:DNA-binding GntR family transcriptional regulator
VNRSAFAAVGHDYHLSADRLDPVVHTENAQLAGFLATPDDLAELDRIIQAQRDAADDTMSIRGLDASFHPRSRARPTTRRLSPLCRPSSSASRSHAILFPWKTRPVSPSRSTSAPPMRSQPATQN